MVRLKGLYFLPILMLSLQGCTKSPSDDWLVGGWMPLEESCNGGGGYFFEATGLWKTEDQEGTWTLDGSILTINVTGSVDESLEEWKPSKDVYTHNITELGKNSFSTSASGKIPAIKWKRCTFDSNQASASPEERSSPPDVMPQPKTAALSGSWFGPSEQKIIWEWTGGYNFMDTSIENRAVVQNQCAKINEPLKQYMANGWQIKSSTPAERTVARGNCQGRDIIIEK